MKEYIERAMAFAVLVDFPGELSPENIGLAVARKAIDALPAADVAEVRHGRWDTSGRYKFLDDSIAIRCTECGAALHLDEYQKYHWHYCPNCGARMDKEDEHES